MQVFSVPDQNVTAALVAWYKKNARDLPWRHDVTPYRVWVSEIMLQQTRVEAVKPYFQRFLQALPDINALACADDEFLHKLWEGLGYYSRVRNMKKCAVRLAEEFGGEMPSDPAMLQTLPGIGSYTAGAIASIAFGVPAPAVDGNVLRILSRLCDCNADIALPAVKKQAEQTVKQMLPQEDIPEFTQSLFELGATVCLPGGDMKCDICPVAAWCNANKNGTAAVLPYHAAKKERKKELHTVLLLRENGRFVLQKRPDKGLLAGLWGFPDLNGHLSERQAIEAARKIGFDPLRVYALPSAVHIFTHKEWHMIGFLIDGNLEKDNVVTADAEQLQSVYALPSAYAVYRGIALGKDTTGKN